MSHHWGYLDSNGPNTWHKEYPIAENGTRQSPIDIVTSKCQKDCAFPPLEVKYNTEKNMKVVNNGHSIQATISEPSEIKGGPLQGTYRLTQFHLHWGADDDQGSEHTVDGKAYAAELHLVHWNTKYGSFAKAASEKDGLAVFGLFIKVGNEHGGFNAITDVTPIPIITEDNAGEAPTIPCFNPDVFIKDFTKYYTYKGSLTTPPLFESVDWFVFDEVMEVSERQIVALRNLVSRDKGPMVNNFRPALDAGDREVKRSF